MTTMGTLDLSIQGWCAFQNANLQDNYFAVVGQLVRAQTVHCSCSGRNIAFGGRCTAARMHHAGSSSHCAQVRES